MAEQGPETFLGSVRKLGIFCSTPERLSILMWSYYTEGHTGVCIGFGTTEQSGSPLYDSKQVWYSEEYPRYNPLEGSATEGDDAALLRKACAWSHESEWRVFNADGPGVVEYGPNVLREIVLGCKIEATHRDEILGWVEESGQKVKVLQARRHDRRFRLELDVIREP